MREPNDSHCTIFTTIRMRARDVDGQGFSVRCQWDCRSEYADLSNEFAVSEGRRVAAEIVANDGTAHPIDLPDDYEGYEFVGMHIWAAFEEASQLFEYIDEHIGEYDGDWQRAMFFLVDFEYDTHIVDGASLAMFGCHVWDVPRDTLAKLGGGDERDMVWRYEDVQLERV